MADPTMAQIDGLERRIRQSNRDDGTFGAAVDDTFEIVRTMLANLTEARASVMAYLSRMQRAEAAHQELVLTQDLYERCQRDRDTAQSQCEIFRRSWLDARDRLELARSELHALKEARRG